MHLLAVFLWGHTPIAWLFVGMNLGSLASSAEEALAKGTVVLAADFEAASGGALWTGDRRYEPGCESPRSLCVDNRTGSGPALVRAVLPAETKSRLGREGNDDR